MDESYIKELAKRKENQTLEFKEYHKVLNQDVFETVCSFANREGGIILIGINDKTHAIVGVDEVYVEQMQKDFTNGCANPEKISPKLTYQLEKIKIEDKYVLYVSIYASAEVHKLNGQKIIDRQGDADIDISNVPDLIANMYLRKRNTYSEDKIYPYCYIEDLRSDVIDLARRLAVIKNENHPWAKMNDLELLKSAGLYLKDHLTGQSGFTLAAILLFGKDITIKSVCPQHRTDCLKIIKNIERYDDRENIRTNLIDTYFKMMKFISKHLDEGFALNDDNTRYSPRDKLFREAVVNTIIHREYRDRSVARMVIEKDKVTFENGCIPYRHGIITLENQIPKSKNPRIADVFNNMGLADELGSGMRNMYKYNKIYCNNIPEFIEGDVFKTIIPLISQKEIEANISNFKTQVINYIKENGSINNLQCRKLLNIERSQSSNLLNSMVKEKLIFRHGKSTNTYYNLMNNDA